MLGKRKHYTYMFGGVHGALSKVLALERRETGQTKPLLLILIATYY